MPKGRLRIYLGAAPGVGKTVAMLSEGARRKERGTDVVIGIVETHGRAHTMKLAEELETIPRATVHYRDTEFTEMDLDAIIARSPEVVLVDELAHTNVPGSANEKRWQDIKVLLDRGMDVISTVNIQHLESLNDAVEGITGIVQQETVPDAVVRAADQIELVDMSPEALRRRMAHGNVYKSDKIDAAMSNYFRIGNLAALRQLALLWLADRVDEGLHGYRDANRIDATWSTRERVVVAISAGPESSTLIRRGARIAARGAGGELVVVHVSRTDGLASVSAEKIAKVRRLTEELGGTFHTVTGEDPAEAILQFARGVNASTIIMGASRRQRWRQLLAPPIISDVIDGSGDIDVHVVTHPLAGSGQGKVNRPPIPMQRVLLAQAFGVVGAILITMFVWYIDAILTRPLGLHLVVQFYLLHTVATAMIGGMIPALVTAVLSSLLVNWFFTPPLGTFTISSPENTVALVLFVIVAVAVSTVVHTSSRRAEVALQAQRESSALAELSRSLLGSTDQLALLLERAMDMLNVPGIAVLKQDPDSNDPPEVVAAAGTIDVLSGNNLREIIDQDHALVLSGHSLPASDQRLLTACAAQAGAILTRRALQAASQSAQALTRDNRARTALLSAVSHDLRTPLAGIKAAIGSLRSTDVDFSPDDEAELQGVIEDSADRLEALVANLLDMSRLQVGALVVKPALVDLGEVLHGAMIANLGAAHLNVTFVGEARTAFADAGLLERVVSNVIENAMRHEPAGGTVHLSVSSLDDRTEIRVADHGVGVPAELREQIFLPFQRSRDAGGDGVGLGLAVARGLTEAMGGTLEAEDTPGGGLTMVINLPRTRPRGAE